MIHICFSLHDKTKRYSKFTGTAICSLFENTFLPPDSITVHILHDNTLIDDNRDKFLYLAGRYNQRIKFYNIEKHCAAKLEEYVSYFPGIKNLRVTVAGLYRLLIPQIFADKLDKVIYLDSDIIVNLDISELWQIDLEDKVIAAAPEAEIILKNSAIADRYLVKNGYVAFENYFNSGVLIMNLKKLSQLEEHIISGIKFRGEHLECDYFDQDILNYLFSGDYLKLEERFDTFISKARKSNKIRPAIYHYIGITLQLDVKDPFNKLWLDYFTKTPWFDVNVVGSFYNCISALNRNIGESKKNLLIKFSAALSGKNRAFVIKAGDDIDWLKQNYLIKDDEEIFICEDNEALAKIIDKMNAMRDKTVFFVRAWEFIEPLKDAGFVEGEDFFNHYVIFSHKLLSQNAISSFITIM